MSDCTHERAFEGRGRLPRSPIPDEITTCPDCGEQVKRHDGRVITLRENNELVRWNAILAEVPSGVGGERPS